MREDSLRAARKQDHGNKREDKEGAGSRCRMTLAEECKLTERKANRTKCGLQGRTRVALGEGARVVQRGWGHMRSDGKSCRIVQEDNAATRSESVAVSE